jgi:hypothetical protein
MDLLLMYPTYIYFFLVVLYFIPVPVEFAHGAFGIQAAPVCSAVVSGVTLVITDKEISKYLPCCDAYSRPHLRLVMILLLVHCFHGSLIEGE